MRVTALHPQQHNPERVEVHLDGEARIVLAAELVYALPLRVGDMLSENQLRELEARDLAWRARDAAYSLLSFRPRTRVELRRRLREKGFPPEVIDRCVEELAERRMLDDASFAQGFVRDRLRFRPRGARLLQEELRSRGVDSETARASVDQVWQQEEVSELDLARQVAAKWSSRSGESRLRARRRLYNFLSRRGFGADIVCEVIDEKLP